MKNSNLRNSLLILLFISILSCDATYKIKELQVYDNTKPSVPVEEVVTEFGRPLSKTPIFSFTLMKEHLHTGLPYPNEMRAIKEEAAKMGAKNVILDCPSPGSVGMQMCKVYGY